MTETAAPKKTAKPRTKPEGPRSHVLTETDGNTFLVRLSDVRVANQIDLDKALDGDMQRGQIVKKTA